MKMKLGLKGKACLIQAISAPVFVGLAWYVDCSAEELSPEASAARKMLLFEGVGQAFLAIAAWMDPTRPNNKEFKDDFDGWVKHSQGTVVRISCLWAMGCFFLMVTAGRLELTSLALGGAYAGEIPYLCGILGSLITASALLGRVPLLPIILGCFVLGPVAAGAAQIQAGNTILGISQTLYIANFPLAMARIITRWQGEILNFIGWFVLAYAVTHKP